MTEAKDPFRLRASHHRATMNHLKDRPSAPRIANVMLSLTVDLLLGTAISREIQINVTTGLAMTSLVLTTQGMNNDISREMLKGATLNHLPMAPPKRAAKKDTSRERNLPRNPHRRRKGSGMTSPRF